MTPQTPEDYLPQIYELVSKVYCSPQHSHKVLDPNLIKDIVSALDTYYKDKFKQAVSVEEIENILNNIQKSDIVYSTKMLSKAIHDKVMEVIK